MIPFDEALQTVLAHARPLHGVERVPLARAYGRYLAADVAAREAIPVADNSAMDGYAVRFADVADEAACRSRPLAVAGVMAADDPGRRALAPGQAMKIMTGAPLPPGADTVVMVENARAEGDRVWIAVPPRHGEHVRRAGSDVGAGEVALHKGDRLTPAAVGMLAALGQPEVTVAPRPRVGVLATGDEIIAPGAPLAPGKVRNANSYTLAGLLYQTGAEPHLLGIAGDDRAALREALARGLDDHDVLLTSGGVSMGDFDYVKQLVDELGLAVHFRAVNVKPGKPVVFGHRDDALFFGLPGNPVSAMVACLQLVRPALLQQMGAPPLGFRSMRVPLSTAFRKADGKRHFLRGILFNTEDGSVEVRLTGDQGSNILHSMGRANCFVVVEEDVEHVEAGELVTVQLLDGEPLPGAH